MFVVNTHGNSPGLNVWPHVLLAAQEMKAGHMESACMRRPVACPYVRIGCRTTVPVCDLSQHLADELDTHCWELVRASQVCALCSLAKCRWGSLGNTDTVLLHTTAIFEVAVQKHANDTHLTAWLVWSRNLVVFPPVF